MILFLFFIISTYFNIIAFKAYKELFSKYNVEKEKGTSLKYSVIITGNEDAIKLYKRASLHTKLGLLALLSGILFYVF